MDLPVAERKSFLLRLPAELLDDLNRWSRDELRSLNAQIEYLLRDAVRRRRRSGDDVQSQPSETANLPTLENPLENNSE